MLYVDVPLDLATNLQKTQRTDGHVVEHHKNAISKQTLGNSKDQMMWVFNM